MNKSLYSDDVYQSSLRRLGELTPETQPKWGRMSVAQMLAHCAEILEVANGKALENTPFVVRLFKGMIRKMVVSDKPFPKSTQTHPQYRQTEERAFEEEKDRLVAAMHRFKEEEGVPKRHPLFGAMSVAESGWTAFKHLDHHLSQFGV